MSRRPSTKHLVDPDLYPLLERYANYPLNAEVFSHQQNETSPIKSTPYPIVLRPYADHLVNSPALVANEDSSSCNIALHSEDVFGLSVPWNLWKPTSLPK
jgi:hypothetical protein